MKCLNTTRVPFQYPIRRLIVRSRKVSKPRDLYLESSDRSEIWQAPRQQCCRSASQISKRCDNFNYQSRGFEALRDLTIRRLIGYWNGSQAYIILQLMIIYMCWLCPSATTLSTVMTVVSYQSCYTMLILRYIRHNHYANHRNMTPKSVTPSALSCLGFS